MESACTGPVMIQERVRRIGGEFLVESTPGHGSRLEITMPQVPSRG